MFFVVYELDNWLLNLQADLGLLNSLVVDK